MEEASRRLAAHLRHAEGVQRGDRVCVVLPQRSALAHLACSRLGAVSTPLSPLFGPEGLASRMGDARPRLVLTHRLREGVVREALALAGLSGVSLRFVDDPAFEAAWRDAAPLARSEEAPVSGEDGAFLVYTSGTTGGAKGALLPHRVVPGRMPGFLLAHEPFDAETGLFYSPADWSWIGGLHDSLLAPWHAGCAVLCQERTGPFDAAQTCRLMAEHAVTDAFLPPTALKSLARSGAAPPASLRLRAVHAAGEPLPAPVAAWARKALCPTVTEVYGLTEAAFLVGTAGRSYVTPEGSMGRPFPGHRVELRDEEIVVRRGDPTLMLGYWRGEGEAPHLPLDADGFLHTGDLAEAMPGGFLRYLGRRDDLIKTSGHRVGPAEVEACLLRHPAVAECAVVGVPDAERGHVIKAFVKVAPGHVASPALEAELQGFVRTRLAAHAHPREVAFVDELPMTVSGKIRRRQLREGPG
jgi:acetyl-CoA synthetase